MDWREALKQHAEMTKARINKLNQSTATMLSFRGGRFSVGGEELENPLEAVVLAVRLERSYYDSPYNPDVQTPPTCYSFDGERPHAETEDPQHETCRGCPWDEFGTSGRGKACKEGARVALILADSLSDIESADILQAKTSVLNTQTLRSYADRLPGPLFLFTTAIKNEQDPKTQYHLTFRMVEKLMLDDASGGALARKVEEAERLLNVPFPKAEDKPAPKAPPAKRGGVRRSKF
jgi:hypothetical protein